MQSLTIQARPLSSNEAWQGRRFKTPEYKAYEQELWVLVPKKHCIKMTGILEVKYRFHFKNHKLRDWDNPIKPLQDILVKLGVIADDRHIYRGIGEKIPSDKDFIEIEIREIEMPA